jgi:hypothetical protein
MYGPIIAQPPPEDVGVSGLEIIVARPDKDAAPPAPAPVAPAKEGVKLVQVWIPESELKR